MLLSKLLHNIPHTVHGSTSKVEVSSIAFDTRKVNQGDLFVTIKGAIADGHDFIEIAVSRGCSAVIVEKMNPAALKAQSTIPVIEVDDSRHTLGLLAANFFDHPATGMTMIGITGTNGKTTNTWLIEDMLLANGLRPGVIGTVNNHYIDIQGEKHEKSTEFTTPEPMELQETLREMADSGVTHVVMEVSSHALELGRVNPISFDIAIFTNLTRDHLDFHSDMQQYFSAKQKLFTTYLKPNGKAIILVDPLPDSSEGSLHENTWGVLLAETLSAENDDCDSTPEILRCGFSPENDVWFAEYKTDIHSTTCTLKSRSGCGTIKSPLVGRFNVLNLLTTATTGIAVGLTPKQICRGLSFTSTIPGRLERVTLPAWKKMKGKKGKKSVFIDYAHTPDALHNVLLALREISKARVICIFGCGGDRDTGKRQLMGNIAGTLADISVITTDNPRTEDPVAIIEAIEQGMGQADLKREPIEQLLSQKNHKKNCYAVIEDRRLAIHTICSLCEDNDIVLIAGKGHENYQIVGKTQTFFDDRIEAVNGLLTWNVQHVLTATGGRLTGGEHKRQLLKNISTNSRTITPGEIFIALSGENFDGHDYIGKAVKQGAGAIIVSRWPDIEFPVPVIVVEDTLKALGDLASYRRRLLAPHLRVIAITGSSGKTTVKEITAAIFKADEDSKCNAKSPRPPEKTLKTQGNFNNLIGLPLSLLAVQASHETAILEMGMNSPGEIARLTKIAEPDIGLINNVQPAHIEGLGSIEGIARAKRELFRELQPEAVIVFNQDDDRVRKLAAASKNPRISFAFTDKGRRQHPEVKATRITNKGANGMRFTLHIEDYSTRLSIPSVGSHNVANCLAAATIAHASGIAPDIIVQGISQYRSGDKRMQFVELSSGIRVINDSYNANPASMKAAIETLAAFEDGCRKVAILGDMLELGSASSISHIETGDLVARKNYDYLIVTGEYGNVTAHGAAAGGMNADRIHVLSNAKEIALFINDLIATEALGQDDWLLIKGSRGMKMENVLKYLQQQGDNKSILPNQDGLENPKRIRTI